MSDTICTLTIGHDKQARLRIKGKEYAAPIRHEALTTLIVSRLDRFVRYHPDGPAGCEPKDLQLLGAVLFDILFADAADQVFRTDAGNEVARNPLGRTLGEQLKGWLPADGAGAGRFRIHLVFENAADPLATYPWEFLWIAGPDGDGFFLSERAMLIRVLAPELDIGGPPERLHILVAWAAPRELGELGDAATMADGIGTALAGVAKCEPLKNASWDDLVTRLADEREPWPDVLHIIAHGRQMGQTGQLAFRRSESEMLALRARAALDPQLSPGEARWTDIGSLAAQLKKTPRLVFLHACSTGRAAHGVEAFRGAAEVIARAGVPFVIAMQYDIANEDAKIFATKFYEAIAKPGASVDDAVRAGRLELGKREPPWGHRRFATPVVYLRSSDTRLVALREAAAPALPPPPPTEAAAELPVCPFAGCFGRIKVNGKHCGCEKRRIFAYCTNGHANDPEDAVCFQRFCDAPVQPLAPASAPPSRHATRSLDEV